MSILAPGNAACKEETEDTVPLRAPPGVGDGKYERGRPPAQPLGLGEMLHERGAAKGDPATAGGNIPVGRGDPGKGSPVNGTGGPIKLSGPPPGSGDTAPPGMGIIAGVKTKLGNGEATPIGIGLAPPENGNGERERCCCGGIDGALALTGYADVGCGENALCRRRPPKPCAAGGVGEKLLLPPNVNGNGTGTLPPIDQDGEGAAANPFGAGGGVNGLRHACVAACVAAEGEPPN